MVTDNRHSKPLDARASSYGRMRYADYLRASGAGALHLRLGTLTPAIEYGPDGRPLPYRPPVIVLTRQEVAARAAAIRCAGPMIVLDPHATRGAFPC